MSTFYLADESCQLSGDLSPEYFSIEKNDTAPAIDHFYYLSPLDLEKQLLGWMWDTPLSSMPSAVEVHEVLSLLKKRPDRGQLKPLIDECIFYVEAFSTHNCLGD